MGKGFDRHTLHLPKPASDPVAEPIHPVRLLAAHGYVREFWSRRVRFDWTVGEVVSDPDEILHLRKRGAELEDV